MAPVGCSAGRAEEALGDALSHAPVVAALDDMEDRAPVLSAGLLRPGTASYPGVGIWLS